jgi:hypothetical protein
MLSTSVCCMPEIIFYAKKFATEPNKQCDVNSKSKDCCLLIRFWSKIKLMAENLDII